MRSDFTKLYRDHGKPNLSAGCRFGRAVSSTRHRQRLPSPAGVVTSAPVFPEMCALRSRLCPKGRGRTAPSKRAGRST
jgi:hypothetical protein